MSSVNFYQESGALPQIGESDWWAAVELAGHIARTHNLDMQDVWNILGGIPERGISPENIERFVNCLRTPEGRAELHERTVAILSGEAPSSPGPIPIH